MTIETINQCQHCNDTGHCPGCSSGNVPHGACGTCYGDSCCPYCPDRSDITTDADGWGHLTGARFVGPDEWLAGLPERWARDSLHISTFTYGLTIACDSDGVILDFRPDEFYRVTLSEMLRDENDDRGWRLEYDRFTAMVFVDVELMLFNAGYLAGRGNGDSKDRRLALPAPAVSRG